MSESGSHVAASLRAAEDVEHQRRAEQEQGGGVPAPVDAADPMHEDVRHDERDDGDRR